MRRIYAVIAMMLVTSAYASDQSDQTTTPQIDTAPIEEPPLPRPKPPLNDVIGDDPAVLISAFRQQNSQGPVIVSPVLTRVAQEQANAMALRNVLDHNALAPFSNRIKRTFRG